MLLPLAWFFYLPYALNLRQALRIRTTGRGRILGYSKSVYTYPLIPGAILYALVAGIGGEAWHTALGAIFVGHLFFTFFVGNEDVTDRSVLGVIGVVLGIVVAVITLEVTDVFDFTGSVGGVIDFFAPRMSPGLPILLALLLAGQFFLMVLPRSRIHSVLEIAGNNYNPAKFRSEGLMSYETHRFTTDTSDYTERFVFGTLDLMLVPALELTKDPDENRRNAAFILENTPAARAVMDAVNEAIEAQDIESGSRGRRRGGD